MWALTSHEPQKRPRFALREGSFTLNDRWRRRRRRRRRRDAKCQKNRSSLEANGWEFGEQPQGSARVREVIESANNELHLAIAIATKQSRNVNEQQRRCTVLMVLPPPRSIIYVNLGRAPSFPSPSPSPFGIGSRREQRTQQTSAKQADL